MNAQEQLWGGDFGDQYTKRNRVNWLERVPFWTEIIARTGAQSALEVGCNFGANLLALRAVKPFLNIHGVEINQHAIGQAKSLGFDVHESSASALEVFRGCFDLTFTAGVLIHIPPSEINAVMDGIAKASRRYVLAVEYYAAVEEQVEYRGGMDRLWKRPYGRMYEDMGLKMIDQGFVDSSFGFDSCTWWLLEKQ